MISSIESKFNSISKENKIISKEIIKQFQLDKYEIHPEIRKINDNWIECCKFGTTKKCNCGTTVQSPHFCGETKICPVCNNVEAMRRMKNIFRTFTVLDKSDTNKLDFYFIHNVLTYPKNHFSKKLSKEEIFNQMFKDANMWKKKTYGKFTASIAVCHSWKTENPLSKENHFHVHMLIPEFYFVPVIEKSLIKIHKTKIDIEKDEIKTFERKSRKIVDYSKMKKIRVYKNTDKMRENWKKILDYDQEVNIFHQYTNSKRKLAHLIKYFSRGYIQDVNDFLLTDEKITLSENQKERIFYHANFELAFNRIRWFGFLCNSQRGKFLKWIIPSDEWEIILKKDKCFEVCPICFEKITFDDGLTEFYNSEFMVRSIRVNMIVYEIERGVFT